MNHCNNNLNEFRQYYNKYKKSINENRLDKMNVHEVFKKMLNDENVMKDSIEFYKKLFKEAGFIEDCRKSNVSGQNSIMTRDITTFMCWNQLSGKLYHLIEYKVESILGGLGGLQKVSNINNMKQNVKTKSTEELYLVQNLLTISYTMRKTFDGLCKAAKKSVEYRRGNNSMTLRQDNINHYGPIRNSEALLKAVKDQIKNNQQLQERKNASIQYHTRANENNKKIQNLVKKLKRIAVNKGLRSINKDDVDNFEEDEEITHEEEILYKNNIDDVNERVNYILKQSYDCPPGYVIVDGDCLKKCDSDQIRNPITRRCNKKCKPGEYRDSNFKCKRSRERLIYTQPQIIRGVRIPSPSTRIVAPTVISPRRASPPRIRRIQSPSEIIRRVQALGDEETPPPSPRRRSPSPRRRSPTPRRQCPPGKEMYQGKCYVKCKPGQIRNPTTKRCKKAPIGSRSPK